MNITELKLKLDLLQVSSLGYSINGDENEAFCILKNEMNEWLVFYSERGEQRGLGVFREEHNACLYFLTFITSDSVVMKKLKSE
jgi:hypothetical protein